MARPHAVLLGAGASLAALPNGDKWGKRLPLMNNVVDVLELGWVFEEHDIPYKGINFETLYSDLVIGGNHPEAVSAVEATAFSYFHGMRLPDHPTIYDHLVLSLRPKDFVATFNWDPFLSQAIERNYTQLDVDPPHIAYLHGCVRIGYCDKHAPITFGTVDGSCLRCGGELTQSQLLYPVAQKNYASDSHCAAAWRDTQMVLNRAMIFTVFGYGAPSSDSEAIGLLKAGWGDTTERSNELVEIIDRPGRPREELEELWAPFINEEGAEVWGDFYDSWIAKCTRRSCDGLWDQQMMLQSSYRDVPVPRELDFPELWEWYRPLIEAEKVQTKDAEQHVLRVPSNGTP